MQVTLRINDVLYQRAKAKSSELGLSFSRFTEEALAERLESSNRLEVKLTVSSARGPVLTQEELRRGIEAEGRTDECEQVRWAGSSGA